MKTRALYLIALFILIQFCSGCNNTEPDNNETIEFVWEYAIENPDGFTVNIHTYKPVTSGISASYYETQNSFGKESLSFVVSHALDHNSIVGGWFNDSDSLYYFDSNKIFPDTALNEAIKFAIDNNQYAVYDITNDSIIWITTP